MLPRISPVPIGGYKMVYEYANRLVADGFDVAIFYDNTAVMEKYKLPEVVKRIIINKRTIDSPTWFNLDTRIERKSSRDRNLAAFFSSVDIAIATGADTVSIVKNKFKSAKGVYFVQDFEFDSTGQNWKNSEEQLYSTYNAGLTKITISKWLKDVIDSHSQEQAIYVRNPLDTDIYRVITPIDKRNTNSIGMLFHDRPRKGCKYTLAALKAVKKDYPNIRVEMFGACPPPDKCPDWINYHQSASQKETVKIYNSVSIFASGPIREGFGLTALEAMACGAAVVSSDNLGAREYAIDGENSLLSPVKDVNAMKKNIEILLKDDDKRRAIARAGVKTARKYSWQVAYKEFKSAILS